MKARTEFAVIMCGGLVACAGQKAPRAPTTAPEDAAAYADAPHAASPATPISESEPLRDAPSPSAAPPLQSPGASVAGTPNRTVALRQALGDADASQRELDVAGGDCRNACRALGSMDRAAGRICDLARSSDELRRCESAKSRLYSARDKVRGTCGTCADVAVERSAPIPSSR